MSMSGSSVSDSSADDFEDRAAALCRRNMGLWAGEKMGLSGDSLENYALAVTRGAGGNPSEEDVIRKVLGDLTASHIQVRESEVRTRAAECLAQAREALRK
jgi:hypothetical protein